MSVERKGELNASPVFQAISALISVDLCSEKMFCLG